MHQRLLLPVAISLVATMLLSSTLLPAFADDPQPQRWVPIGASYAADTLELFAAQAADYDTDDVVQIRLLPITYAFDAYVITPRERAENLELLQRRANQLLNACQDVVVLPVTCEVTIIDMQIRSDAEDPDKVALLSGDVDGVYIPGGDQVIAIEVIRNTAAETALGALFAAGAPIGGNSAGAAVQSYHMIAGYTGDNYPWDGLREGAIDLWYGDVDPDQRGLVFGLQPAVVEQHVLQRGRLARLLQAVNALPDSHVGVGLDNATAAVIEDGASVYDVTGLTAAAVVDLDTYEAEAGASYPAEILSLRNGALHLLPPGGYSYDLGTREPAWNGSAIAAPDLSGRSLDLVRGLAGSGTLFVAGDLTPDTGGPVIASFAQIASAQSGQTLVIGLGDPNGAGQSLASNWKEPLRRAGIRRVESTSITPGMSPKALDAVARQVQQAGALMVVSEQQDYVAALLDALVSVGVVDRWSGGTPMLLDNGAAAAAGEWMSAEPTPTRDELEDQGSESFLVSGSYAVDVAPGLSMIPGVAFEPRALYDYRYGRLVSLIHADNDLVAFGIDRATALVITPEGATVLGDNGVFVIDGRYGATAAGTNDAIAATWMIVDTYAPGEMLQQ